MTIASPQKYGSAAARWAGIGPYYAMFPTWFSDQVIRKHTKLGDTVLDPFAGRGTSIFSAAVQRRSAVGIEINPLGYVYAKTKLAPSRYNEVMNRLEYLGEIAYQYREEANNLPLFFHYCFADGVREFLLAARDALDWRCNKTDRTLMAFILISLHGKIHQSLSNQMRQSTAMAPNYCIRWWTEKSLLPPHIDPIMFLAKRIKWRYARGIPDIKGATVFLQDSTRKLPAMKQDILECKRPKAKLLFTSPPYHNVTNYYCDQWLRLWLLGCPENPREHGNRYGGKFGHEKQYRKLLNKVFKDSKAILTGDATIYVRTDKRPSTFNATKEALIEVFPDKRIRQKFHPMKPEQQTKPYSRGGAPKQANCEVDIILTPQ